MGKSKSKDKEREKDDKSIVKEKKPVKKERDEVKSSQNGDMSLVVEDEENAAVIKEKVVLKEEKDFDRPDYDKLASFVTVISKPLASRKLTKRLYKTVRKASKVKTLKRGVKEVVKAIRKGEQGLVVIAGDVTPIDVISHVPVMCEDRSLPYCYVPAKLDLGLASLTKRPTSIVMIKKHVEISDNYDKCFTEVKALPLPI